MLQIRRAPDGSYVLIDGRPEAIEPVSDEGVGFGGMLGVLLIVALISAAVAGAILWFTMLQMRPGGGGSDKDAGPWGDAPPEFGHEEGRSAPAERAETAPAVDPWKLYRKQGRSWTLRSESSGITSLMRYEIVAANDQGATLRVTVLDSDGNELMPGTDTRLDFVPVENGDDAGGPELIEETITVKAGTFRCHRMDTGGQTFWSSADYPGLVVKVTGNNMSMELIEFTD